MSPLLTDLQTFMLKYHFDKVMYVDGEFDFYRLRKGRYVKVKTKEFPVSDNHFLENTRKSFESSYNFEMKLL